MSFKCSAGVVFRSGLVGFAEWDLWNRNNDFANVLAGFHVAMRVCDVLQVKGSINYRDKFPGLHSVNNESFALVRRAGTRVVSNSV
jgi:hypothetical protein